MPATTTRKAHVPADASDLYGKPIRFSFDKASGGATYDHTFNRDGSVDFAAVKDGKAGEPAHVSKSAVVKIDDGVFLASYLGDAGYALTVALNFNDGTVTGFASNEHEWSKHTGRLEFA